MERPPIGALQGYDYKTEDIYVYNRTGSTSVIGDCVMADHGNTAGFTTDYTQDGSTPTGPNMNAVLIPAGAAIAKDFALMGIVQEAVANNTLMKIRVRGRCAVINATNVGAAGAAAGSALAVQSTTGTAGKLDAITATANIRTIGYTSFAHTAAAGAEALTGVIDGTTLRK